jgi:multicomponent Na+:H+ antiporter subunit E
VTRLPRYTLSFLILFGFWLLFSGHYDLFHIGIGVVVSLTITYTGRDLFQFPLTKKKYNWFKIALYPFYLLKSIIESNIGVAYLALHPRIPVDPIFFKFPSTLKSRSAKIILANSITLTPGTITVRIDAQDFTVHGLSKRLAQSVTDACLPNRVAELFGDAPHKKENLVILNDEELV